MPENKQNGAQRKAGGMVERPCGADWLGGTGQKPGPALTAEAEADRGALERALRQSGRSWGSGGKPSDIGHHGGGSGRCTARLRVVRAESGTKTCIYGTRKNG